MKLCSAEFQRTEGVIPSNSRGRNKSRARQLCPSPSNSGNRGCLYGGTGCPMSLRVAHPTAPLRFTRPTPAFRMPKRPTEPVVDIDTVISGSMSAPSASNTDVQNLQIQTACMNGIRVKPTVKSLPKVAPSQSHRSPGQTRSAIRVGRQTHTVSTGHSHTTSQSHHSYTADSRPRLLVNSGLRHSVNNGQSRIGISSQDYTAANGNHVSFPRHAHSEPGGQAVDHQSKKRRSQTPHDDGDDGENGEIFCICRTIDNEKHPMINCDDCGEWYHYFCISLTEDEAISVEQSERKWFCFRCENPKKFGPGIYPPVPPEIIKNFWPSKETVANHQQCDHCPKEFANVLLLNAHVRAHHRKKRRKRFIEKEEEEYEEKIVRLSENGMKRQNAELNGLSSIPVDNLGGKFHGPNVNGVGTSGNMRGMPDCNGFSKNSTDEHVHSVTLKTVSVSGGDPTVNGVVEKFDKPEILPDSKTVQPISCVHCDEDVRGSNEFLEHLRSCHSDSIMRSCRICLKDFRTRNLLALHMVSHINDTKSDAAASIPKVCSNTSGVASNGDMNPEQTSQVTISTQNSTAIMVSSMSTPNGACSKRSPEKNVASNSNGISRNANGTSEQKAQTNGLLPQLNNHVSELKSNGRIVKKYESTNALAIQRINRAQSNLGVNRCTNTQPVSGNSSPLDNNFRVSPTSVLKTNGEHSKKFSTTESLLPAQRVSNLSVKSMPRLSKLARPSKPTTSISPQSNGISTIHTQLATSSLAKSKQSTPAITVPISQSQSAKTTQCLPNAQSSPKCDVGVPWTSFAGVSQADLRCECRLHSLMVRGSKDDLFRRLRTHYLEAHAVDVRRL
eukprot:400672_1